MQQQRTIVGILCLLFSIKWIIFWLWAICNSIKILIQYYKILFIQKKLLTFIQIYIIEFGFKQYNQNNQSIKIIYLFIIRKEKEHMNNPRCIVNNTFFYFVFMMEFQGYIKLLNYRKKIFTLKAKKYRLLIDLIKSNFLS